MNAVEVAGVSKSFNATKVVDDLSFTCQAGVILGMVGPNGAGKTTTMRMLMDIIKPDTGEVRVFGLPPNERTKDSIGYLPEERGLYRKLTVSDCLGYLASLKSMSSSAARSRAQELLVHVGMAQHQHKKIEELSRGMSQLVQFVATILHDPALVVLDEPISGLDPVNAKMLKDMLAGLRQQGKCVILSTHLMNEVEELCDRVLMINRGKAVLYGRVSEVKARYRHNSVFFEGGNLPEKIPGAARRTQRGQCWELFLDERADPQQVLASLLGSGVRIDRFEVATPSLNEIFIRVAEQSR